MGPKLQHSLNTHSFVAIISHLVVTTKDTKYGHCHMTTTLHMDALVTVNTATSLIYLRQDNAECEQVVTRQASSVTHG